MHSVETCTHCHSEITHTRIVNDLGVFCCSGCQQVYHILNQDEFGTYHHLLKIQDSKPPRARKSPKYQKYLDQWMESDKWKTQGSWRENVQTLDFNCDEVHCAACSWLLEKQFAKSSGVKSVQVDFVHGRVKLSYDPTETPLEEIMTQSSSLGYPLKFETKEAKRKIQKSTLIRLAISGAVMMNVMTFSYGGYFALDGGMESEWKNLFAWLSMILNIPVITYCAWPFYEKAWKGLRVGVLHMDLPVSLGIIIAYVLSIFLMFQGDHPYFDSVSGLVFFLLGGRWFSQSFERWLTPDPRWFQNQIPHEVEVQNSEGQYKFVPVSEVTIGQVVRINSESILPFSARLKSLEANFDSSWMTGESRPHYYQQGDEIPSGFRNIGDTLELECVEVTQDSQLNQLQNNWLNRGKDKNNAFVAEKVERIVPWFVGVVLILSVLRGFYEWYLNGDTWSALQEAMVVLIISCPCALALSRPISLGLAMKKAREMGYLLRNGEVLEELKEINAFLFDKTGTLTWTWHPIEHWQWDNGTHESDQQKARRVLRSMCQRSSHPYSQSVFEELGEEDEVFISDFDEVVARGLRCHVDGHTWEFISTREFFESNDSEDFNNFQNVLLLNSQPVAWVQFAATIRNSVKEMVAEIQGRGQEVILLSGDREKSVKEFAEQVGITQYYAECSPESKAEICREIKSQGKSTAAMGDGMNDTLLLHEADISVVVQGGHYQLDDHTDIMSLGQDGESLNDLLRLPHILEKSVMRAYTTSVIYNLLVLSLAFSGYVAPLVAAIAMPLSTLSVLLVIRFSMVKKNFYFIKTLWS